MAFIPFYFLDEFDIFIGSGWLDSSGQISHLEQVYGTSNVFVCTENISQNDKTILTVHNPIEMEDAKIDEIEPEITRFSNQFDSQ